jgi:hypothetical protein
MGDITALSLKTVSNLSLGPGTELGDRIEASEYQPVPRLNAFGRLVL